MKTVDIAIEQIKPYEKNPRHNENAVEAVAQSIKQFGFQQPLVLDKNYVIIVGHTRFKASQELGLKTVPCVIADNLTEEQVKAYRLADNKVGELATWDFEMLRAELDEIPDIEMTDFGFDLEGVDIDWDNVGELDEDSYEEPKKDMLQCPNCSHIDSKNHFMKVD